MPKALHGMYFKKQLSRRRTLEGTFIYLPKTGDECYITLSALSLFC